MNVRRPSLGLLPLVVLLASCAFRTPSGPMRVVREDATCRSRPETVLVLLPGSFSTPEDFIENGFVRAVRERRLAVDLLLPDASLGYYNDRTILDHLQADVIEPARQRGYRRVVLAGISIGAFGALIDAEAHPGQAATVIAIAPYLGSTLSTHLIEAAGGLRAWRTPEGPLQPEDDGLWRWLQGYATAAPDRPPLWLAYGRSDRFVRADRLLAAALPADRSFTADGGHDWPAWRPLWNQLLDAGALGVPTCEAP